MLNPFSQGEPSEAVSPQSDERSKEVDRLGQIELRNAKLWTRIDELENQLARQHESLALLEQSLNLGIKPAHLQKKAAPAVHQDLPIEQAPLPELQKPRPTSVEQAPAEVSRDDEHAFPSKAPADPQFESMFAEAHEMYLAGRFGPAILKLADLERTFGAQMAGGIHVYWVGRCWLALKEFATARSRLEEYIKSSPKSPYLGRAKVDLAKAEHGAGLTQTAVRRLQEVMQQHPYEDAAELARHELDQIKRAL
jgi:TolA-binding protein